MLTFYFPGLAVAVFGHIQATAILHSWRLHIKGAYVEREIQVSSSSTSKQRWKFRNCLHNVLYTRVQSDCLTKLRVGTVLRLNIFFFFFYATKTWLTHRCVKSNVLLVRVEIFVLLPAELTNVAPSFCRQENTRSNLFCTHQRRLMLVVKKENCVKSIRIYLVWVRCVHLTRGHWTVC